MNPHVRHTASGGRAARRVAGWMVTACLLLPTVLAPSASAERTATEARSGLDIAQESAIAWAPDAFLTYIENDEPLDGRGATTRWGYLFYSPNMDKSRAYSVRDRKILVAENLDMKLEAPPLAGGWIDSGAAFAVAEQSAGRDFRIKYDGSLSTMLLMRGAFHDGDPDRTTWTLIYTSPKAPSLFVVVDATEGKVRRTWRG